MKKTLLNTAGALALTVAFGAGVALADDNNLRQYGPFNFAAQDFLNGTGNGNGSNNDLGSGNDNDRYDVDVANTGNDNLNRNGSNNALASGNDNDRYDIDARVVDAGNDKSADDNDGLDLDLRLTDSLNDKSHTNTNNQQNWKQDNSLDISDIAFIASDQALFGLAAAVNMSTGHGNLTTGDVTYGDQTNVMAAGNMTTSNNTGAGTISQSTSGIQANGQFRVR